MENEVKKTYEMLTGNLKTYKDRLSELKEDGFPYIVEVGAYTYSVKEGKLKTTLTPEEISKKGLEDVYSQSFITKKNGKVVNIYPEVHDKFAWYRERIASTEQLLAFLKKQNDSQT
jgi:hypothetical protein